MLDELVSRMGTRSGVLMLVGREPFPFPARVGTSGARASDAAPWAARVVLDTERLRDAAMLLSHQVNGLPHYYWPSFLRSRCTSR